MLVEAQIIKGQTCFLWQQEHVAYHTKNKNLFADTMMCTRTRHWLCAVRLFHGNPQRCVHRGGDCHTKFILIPLIRSPWHRPRASVSLPEERSGGSALRCSQLGGWAESGVRAHPGTASLSTAVPAPFKEASCVCLNLRAMLGAVVILKAFKTLMACDL